MAISQELPIVLFPFRTMITKLDQICIQIRSPIKHMLLLEAFPSSDLVMTGFYTAIPD